MWDVIWTDPDKELVGEHRARKEKEKDQREREQARSARNSLSTHSSVSSSDSPFAFLRSQGLKSIGISRKNSRAKSSASSALASGRSPLSPTFDIRSRRSSGLAATGDSSLCSRPSDASKGRPHFLGTGAHSSENLSPAFSFHDSGFSKTTGNDTLSPAAARADCSTEFREQSAARAELSSTTSNLVFKAETQLAEILISNSSKSGAPSVPPRFSRDSADPLDSQRSESPTPLLAGLSLPIRPQSADWSLQFNAHNPDSWHTPDEWKSWKWDTELTESSVPETLNDSPATFAYHGRLLGEPDELIDFKSLQKDVERMAAADPSVILLRLHKVWSPVPDLLRTKEHEQEKKRWMHSILHHLDAIPERDGLRTPTSKIPLAKADKLLVFHESTGTVSYLAALHHTKQIVHLSPAPLLDDSFTTVQRLLVPSISPTALPNVPSLCDAVFSLTLPAICPSCDIPGMLDSVGRCLRPGGTLQLTLIDPLPCAGTLGQHMRAWIEKHLILNLEKNFRCTSPSKLFPQWLGDASLRGPGSTLTTTKFFAIPANARGRQRDPDAVASAPAGVSSIRTERAEKRTKAELRSLAGRMLWLEVWGAFVMPPARGAAWWWDDSACVEECTRLGTFWEYHTIEGVKNG